jgi:acetyl-CoA C-acetyltransferase
MVDYMNGILHDPFGAIHMGVTAENVASRYAITREVQDELAVERQRRARSQKAASRRKLFPCTCRRGRARSPSRLTSTFVPM